MVKPLRDLVSIVALLSGGLLVLSFLGAWLGPGDSFAVIRVPLAVLFALAVIWSEAPLWLRAGLAMAAMAVPAMIVMMRLDAPELGTDLRSEAGPNLGPIRVYQKNLGWWNAAVGPLAADIRASGADVITLQELSRHNRHLMDELAESHPHQWFCDFPGHIDNAVLSRWPVAETGAFCSETRGFAGVQVMREGQPFWVVSVHLSWPWPYGQRAQVNAAWPGLAELDGAVILGGDFNMVPWGSSVRRMAAAVSGTIAGPLRPSFLREFGPEALRLPLPLPIDHVIAPGGGQISLRPPLGSDHKGVVADVFLSGEGT